jgi:predicted nucleic acid-binding protein
VSQIVVSDSTCLIALERIGRLDLLPAVFEQIWIPPAVAAEFGAPLPWLRVRAPADTRRRGGLRNRG